MQEGSDLARLKAAYAAWDRCKAEDIGMWLALVDDNIVLNPIAASEPGLEFTRPGSGRERLIAYFDALRGAWRMLCFRPITFVAEGERIAMFGETSWEFRATGRTATTAVAHLWRFEGGTAVEWTEIFDGSTAAAAAMMA
ncbi:nuclear transport factor 2 family protein [Ancylobacter terrae]|uniref:nuclear transport factor 2 family protein n=1 Tax=Ancylobacter sp. sgz301288 TaxID=3342077 RepID=UPI00385C92A1